MCNNMRRKWEWLRWAIITVTVLKFVIFYNLLHSVITQVAMLHVHIYNYYTSTPGTCRHVMSHAVNITAKKEEKKLDSFSPSRLQIAPFCKNLKPIVHDRIVNLEGKWLHKILGFNCGHYLPLRFPLHHSQWAQ